MGARLLDGEPGRALYAVALPDDSEREALYLEVEGPDLGDLTPVEFLPWRFLMRVPATLRTAEVAATWATAHLAEELEKRPEL